jgi:hypothetical protein
MKDLLKIVVVMAGVGACIYLYLKWRAFLDQHGVPRSLRDPRVGVPERGNPKSVQGNTKDEDQI